MLIFVVPQFTEMFESAGQELPVSTQIVVGIAEWLQSYWWLLIGGAILCGQLYEVSTGRSGQKKGLGRPFS